MAPSSNAATPEGPDPTPGPLLSYITTVFGWAIERGAYGLGSSPRDHIRAERTLAHAGSARAAWDPMSFALWRAVARMPYPVGPAYTY